MTTAIIGTDSKLCRRIKRLLRSQNHRVVFVCDPSLEQFTVDELILVVLASTLSKRAEPARSPRGQRTQLVAAIKIQPDDNPMDVVAFLNSSIDDCRLKSSSGKSFLARMRKLLRRESNGKVFWVHRSARRLIR